MDAGTHDLVRWARTALDCFSRRKAVSHMNGGGSTHEQYITNTGNCKRQQLVLGYPQRLMSIEECGPQYLACVRLSPTSCAIVLTKGSPAGTPPVRLVTALTAFSRLGAPSQRP